MELTVKCDDTQCVVTIDGKEYTYKMDENVSRETLADWFDMAIGCREWDEGVSSIQNWYYGYVSKTPWCATAICYLADKMGNDTLKKIGGKNENVYYMMMKCIECDRKQYGEFWNKGYTESIQIKRGDILFFNWDKGNMTSTSSKHVTVAEKDAEPLSTTIACVGGNQSDMIKVTTYPRESLYAVYRPNY